MATYKEVQESKEMSLEDKAKWMVAEYRDYMDQGEQVLIVHGPDEVWLCENTGIDLDECPKIRRVL